MEQKTGIKQQVISRLENPYYGKATLTTLKKMAAANDVGLLVEFVPYSELINRVSGTPYVERGYRPETMNVPSFEEEEKEGVLEEGQNDNANLSRLRELYPDITPTGAREMPMANAAMPTASPAADLGFGTPSASGAIQDEIEIPSGSYLEISNVVMGTKRVSRTALPNYTRRRFRVLVNTRKENTWRKRKNQQTARKVPKSSRSFGAAKIMNPYMQIMSTSTRANGD
jgi:hypothetical protein